MVKGNVSQTQSGLRWKGLLGFSVKYRWPAREHDGVRVFFTVFFSEKPPKFATKPVLESLPCLCLILSEKSTGYDFFKVVQKCVAVCYSLGN